MHRVPFSTSVLLVILLTAARLLAQDQPRAGIVSHISVTSDKIEDVSSLAAWKQSFIKPGMTDQQKAIAIWESVVKFRHQDVPPNEYFEAEDHVHDPIEAFNVYGYGQCCCASAHIEALARYAGLEARAWGIVGHSVPELRVGGNWCMLDASLINYLQKPDGSIAGVEQISRQIDAWYAQHPQFKGDDAKLRQFSAREGWKGGPEALSWGRFYDANGWLPAATHGWSNSMQEFGSPAKNFIYDYGAALGYEVNIQLRPGEKLVRNWSNKGLHINMLDGGKPACLDMPNGTADLRYAPKFGDLAPGRIGNGTLDYTLPLASGLFRAGMLETQNLVTKSEDADGPAIHVKDPRQPATLIFRMPSSYVYLSGQLNLKSVIGAGGSIEILSSDNNGLDWKPLATINDGGEQTIDLTPLVFRRYDYRLKFQLKGSGTGLDLLAVHHDIQHSQRPLPALDQGENHIHFAAGPREGTITILASTNPHAEGKALSYGDFHPTLSGIDVASLRLDGPSGQITFPIQTPGDITRLRVGVNYRARDLRDGWTIEASFDDGKSWKPIGDLEGGHAGFSTYLVFTGVPPHSRAALVRFSGRQRNTTLIFSARIAADYLEPNGGFAPIKVTYEWTEGGKAKREEFVAKGTDANYTISCAERPVMKSITLEFPG
ncbi:MAG TPA: hypothetical protein VH370_05490 [Humisphaera sp.]|jgi:hypothetical protein|nr:hypothetical protein [Humisphaera sp.]